VDNVEGLSPLHCAALADSVPCAKLLLDAKADPALAAFDERYSPLSKLRLVDFELACMISYITGLLTACGRCALAVCMPCAVKK